MLHQNRAGFIHMAKIGYFCPCSPELLYIEALFTWSNIPTTTDAISKYTVKLQNVFAFSICPGDTIQVQLQINILYIA